MNILTNNQQILKWWFWLASLTFAVQYIQPEEVFRSLTTLRPHLLCVVMLLPFLLFGRYDIFQWKYPQMKAFWLFVGVMIALTPFSIASYDSFDRTQFMIAFGVFMSSLIITINSTDRLKTFVNVMLVVTGYIIIRAFMTREATDFAEFQFSQGANYFSDPNELSMFMCMMMPFAYFMFLYEQKMLKRAIYMLALVSMILLTILTFSRGGFLGLIATAVVAWWYTPNKKGTWILVSACIIAVVTVSPTLWSMWQQEMSTATDLNAGTAATRLMLWQTSVQIFLANPFGIGASATPYYMWEFTRGISDHISHSVWFTTLVEEGIIGILLLLGLVVKNFHDTSQISNSDINTESDRFLVHFALACKVSLIAFIVSGSFITMVYAPHLWYLSALIVIGMKLRFLNSST